MRRARRGRDGAAGGKGVRRDIRGVHKFLAPGVGRDSTGASRNTRDGKPV
ncbi:hypothetical protein MSMEG_6270 [Mycolicibacterium smegmatis MC2 155]|uniref:Uncharacterized protein n=1 Tax=Mycolicibacterium smegmatis (strain ATCC 700084 / mc(2)155) TaxID=246196 RepID=A0R5Q1_MYCS2|nr:hypothetical protein MSMEG_6270 [Mycolicibacterium smegmatis MC2 155]